MKLEDHPTVRYLANQGQQVENTQEPDPMLEGAWLRRLAMDGGADDAGVVEITRLALDAQRDEILRNYPWTRFFLGLVFGWGREPVRGRLGQWLTSSSIVPAMRSMRSAQRLWP